jgi:hypoxanthine phosphoribosyltransferase
LTGSGTATGGGYPGIQVWPELRIQYPGGQLFPGPGRGSPAHDVDRGYYHRQNKNRAGHQQYFFVSAVPGTCHRTKICSFFYFLNRNLLIYPMDSGPLLQISDLSFVPFISHGLIKERIRAMGTELNARYEGKTPLFVPVLNGAFMFAADLMKEICIPCEVSFVKLASYEGIRSTGDIEEVMGLNADIRDRHVVLLEDIVDTGLTIQRLMATFQAFMPASLEVAALFVKPESVKVPLDIAFRGFDIENKFIVGYGLDYNGLGRNYRDVYQLAGV